MSSLWLMLQAAPGRKGLTHLEKGSTWLITDRGRGHSR
jgi:hypothetical protein